jgi:hypothetical protein
MAKLAPLSGEPRATLMLTIAGSTPRLRGCVGDAAAGSWIAGTRAAPCHASDNEGCSMPSGVEAKIIVANTW